MWKKTRFDSFCHTKGRVETQWEGKVITLGMNQPYYCSKGREERKGRGGHLPQGGE